MNDPIDFPPAMNPAREPERPLLGADEFISRDALEELVTAGEVRVHGSLARTAEGELYALRDGLRVLGNVSVDTDPYGFTGRVDTLAAFLRHGFVISAERIALGRSVYDVEYGFLVQRVSGSADASGAHPAVTPAP